MPTLVPANTPVATQRYVYFDLRGADGITPATAEAGGQPQVSASGVNAWTNAGIGTLAAIGHGRYYAVLTQAAVASPCTIQTRYASANTAECPGDSIQVVAVNVYDGVAFGLANLDATVGSRLAAGGSVNLSPTGLDAIPVADPGGVAGMTTIPAMIVALWRKGYGLTTLTATQLTTYADDGVTANTTQDVSSNATIQVCGAAH